MAKNIKFAVEGITKQGVILDFLNLEDFNTFVSLFGVQAKDETCIQINNYNGPKPRVDSYIKLDIEDLYNNYTIEPFDDSLIIGYILNPKH